MVKNKTGLGGIRTPTCMKKMLLLSYYFKINSFVKEHKNETADV